MKSVNVAAALFGVAVGLCGLSAHAMTFADYGAVGSAANLDWTQSSSLTSGVLSTPGSGVSTSFSFLSAPLSSLTGLSALFTLTATAPAVDPVDPGLLAGGVAAQKGLTGAFNFSYAGSTPLVVGTHTYLTGATLLHGTFSGAELFGLNFGSTTSLQDAVLSGGVVGFTSDFINFSSTGDKALSLALTSVLPIYGALKGSSLLSFTGVSTGSFASDLSSGGGGGGIPEPAVWAMLLTGFAGVGLVVRRRKGALATVGA